MKSETDALILECRDLLREVLDRLPPKLEGEIVPDVPNPFAGSGTAVLRTAEQVDRFKAQYVADHPGATTIEVLAAIQAFLEGKI